MSELYDTFGVGYASGRQTDPYIASQIYKELQDVELLLNIGAGTGSYEPSNVNLIALEPSAEMIRQRPASASIVIRGRAEELPFQDKTFSHTMTILSLHHWQNCNKAFAEIARVTRRRFVVLTWLPESNPFWLTRDYFPEIYEKDRHIFPTINCFYESFKKIEAKKLLVPANCRDGFMAAYWRRPEAYLDNEVRQGISTFYKINDPVKGLSRLEKEIKNGTWLKKYSNLLEQDFLDAGYKIITVNFL